MSQHTPLMPRPPGNLLCDESNQLLPLVKSSS
jgi:hypothetical protein